MAKIKVLLIEDNRLLREGTTALLNEQADITAVASAGNRSALEKARELVPDVVLLDLGMPGVTGYEIAEVIKSEDGLRHVRLFAVTGHGLPLDRVQTKVVGFDRHFLKPVDVEDLEKCLKSIQDAKECVEGPTTYES